MKAEEIMHMFDTSLVNHSHCSTAWICWQFGYAIRLEAHRYGDRVLVEAWDVSSQYQLQHKVTAPQGSMGRCNHLTSTSGSITGLGHGKCR